LGGGPANNLRRLRSSGRFKCAQAVTASGTGGRHMQREFVPVPWVDRQESYYSAASFRPPVTMRIAGQVCSAAFPLGPAE